MRRWQTRILAGAAMLLAAGTLAQSGHWSLLRGGADPAVSSSEDAGATTAPDPVATAEADPATGTLEAVPDPPLGAAVLPAAEALDPAPVRLTRNELEAFAGAIAEATGSQPAGVPVLAAAGVIPSAPTELINGLNQPLFATAIPGDERIFALEKAGRIEIVMPDKTLRAEPFLDLRNRVESAANERGLLGMAFPPDHPQTGLFYLYFTESPGGAVVVSRFSLLDGRTNIADPNSEEVILRIQQPQTNHNGGTIAFSPADGFLYIGTGDGGGSSFNGQKIDTLLGKMLRINVGGGLGSGYTIPLTNPYAGDPVIRNEIWTLGLRNPFRWSFDALTGDQWIGDVGENNFEEINLDPVGISDLNFGWDPFEGPDAFLGSQSSQSIGTLVFPAVFYGHPAGPVSVTGGIRYRGPLVSIQGEYFFADFFGPVEPVTAVAPTTLPPVPGQVWSFDPVTIELFDRTADFNPAGNRITAFGEDGFLAMLVVQIDGRIFRVGSTGDECANAVDDDLDGAVDFGQDEGCSSVLDPSEHNPDAACDDGLDNDRDGRIDRLDSDCPDRLSDGELPEPGAGGGGGDDDGGGGCGLGFELVLVVPLLGWARRRLKRSAP